MTTILYIILGISIGVGSTLIFLQERFIRERRLVIAASEADREKSTKLLKELDEKWELECDEYKQEINALREQLDNSMTENAEELLAQQESQIENINKENTQLKQNISALQDQLSEIQNEATFLKGEIARLEDEKQRLPSDDFLVLGPPGGHLLPGTVARALMQKKES